MTTKSFKFGAKSSSNDLLALGNGWFNSKFRSKDSTLTGLKCVHYEGTKHMKKTCVKLHEYSNWSVEFQLSKKLSNTCDRNKNLSNNIGKQLCVGIETNSSKVAMVASQYLLSLVAH